MSDESSAVTNGPNDEDSEAPANRSRFGRLVGWAVLVIPLFLPRLILAAAGIAALVVGLKAAWHANTATTALIVAAVMLGLAVILTPDLEELSAWFKEGGLRYRRSRAEGAATAYAEVGQALQAALEEEGEDSLRNRIAAIASESTKAAVQEALEADRRSKERARSLASRIVQQRQRTTGGSVLANLAAQLSHPRPTHELVDGRLALRLHNPPSNIVTCTVRTPQGQNPTKILAKAEQARVGDTLETTYPDDFPSAISPPVTQGHYRVEWWNFGPRSEGGRVRWVPGELIVADEFDVPEADASSRETATAEPAPEPES